MPVRGWTAVWALLLLAGTGVAQEAKAQATPPARPRAGGRPCRQVQMEGTVTAGGSFRKAFAPGLDFLLEAVPHGWVIRVLPSAGARPAQDFAEVATPPFRSINPLLLTTDFGFRAQDVVGWNPRTFRYVRRASEFPEAQRAYLGATSSRRPTTAEDAAVTRVAMRAIEGRLEMLDTVLAPGSADQSAAAGLVSSHFATTAHAFRAPQSGPTGALGQVLSLRFRVTLSAPDTMFCDPAANAAQKH